MVSSETEVADEKDDKKSEDDAKDTQEDTSGDSAAGEHRSGDEEDVKHDDSDLSEAEGGDNVKFVTTACGDYHNLAIDAAGEETRVPASDWSGLVRRPGYWPLIGQERSGDQDTGL